jgi:hypothetical protein
MDVRLQKELVLLQQTTTTTTTTTMMTVMFQKRWNAVQLCWE